jgi:hypothetical protein
MWVSNVTTESTEILGTIVFPTSVKHGESFTVIYDLVRHKSCTLDVARLLEDDEKRETVLVQQFQSFEGDDVVRQVSFEIPVPHTIKPGDYLFFSRSRYYCNVLDSILPRYVTTTKVPIHVD